MNFWPKKECSKGHRFNHMGWDECPKCTPGQVTKLDKALKILEMNMDIKTKIESKILSLKTKFLFKSLREKEISEMSDSYENEKKEMKGLLEDINSKNFYHAGIHVSMKEHKGPKVLDLSAFMKWAMKNINKDEFNSLFMPQKKNLKEFINNKFAEKSGVESVLFDTSIPGLESETTWTTLHIKEHENDDTKRL